MLHEKSLKNMSERNGDCGHLGDLSAIFLENNSPMTSQLSSFQKTPVLFVLTEFKNMSVDPEDWDVDFAFPDFNLVLFERKFG